MKRLRLRRGGDKNAPDRLSKGRMVTPLPHLREDWEREDENTIIPHAGRRPESPRKKAAKDLIRRAAGTMLKMLPSKKMSAADSVEVEARERMEDARRKTRLRQGEMRRRSAS